MIFLFRSRFATLKSVRKFIVFAGIIGLFFLLPIPIRADCIGNCDASHTFSCSTPPNDAGISFPICCSTQAECNTASTPPNLTTSGVETQTAKISPYCGNGKSINTAIGCIDPSGSGIFQSFFAIGSGIAGGIAFLLIILGGFQMMTSAGNPEQLNAGKELVTSAVAGLLLIIFSVFILRIIGVDILGIPDFK